MDSRISSRLTYALVSGLVLAIFVPQGMAQANVTGQWSTLPYEMPINPVHVALLSSGNVLVVAGSGNCPLRSPVVLRDRPMAHRITPEHCYGIR
jgi:hypothetical protein